MNLISILKETAFKRKQIILKKLEKLSSPKIEIICMTCGETTTADELSFLNFKNDGEDKTFICEYCKKSKFKKKEKIKVKKNFKIKTPKFVESIFNLLILILARLFAELYKVIERFLNEDLYPLLKNCFLFAAFCISSILVKIIFNIDTIYSFLIVIIYIILLIVKEIYNNKYPKSNQ